MTYKEFEKELYSLGFKVERDEVEVAVIWKEYIIAEVSTVEYNETSQFLPLFCLMDHETKRKLINAIERLAITPLHER